MDDERIGDIGSTAPPRAFPRWWRPAGSLFINSSGAQKPILFSPNGFCDGFADGLYVVPSYHQSRRTHAVWLKEQRGVGNPTVA